MQELLSAIASAKTRKDLNSLEPEMDSWQESSQSEILESAWLDQYRALKGTEEGDV